MVGVGPSVGMRIGGGDLRMLQRTMGEVEDQVVYRCRTIEVEVTVIEGLRVCRSACGSSHAATAEQETALRTSSQIIATKANLSLQHHHHHSQESSHRSAYA